MDYKRFFILLCRYLLKPDFYWQVCDKNICIQCIGDVISVYNISTNHLITAMRIDREYTWSIARKLMRYMSKMHNPMFTLSYREFLRFPV